MLTAILSLLTVLSWFFVVSNAGGFAPVAMMLYVPGYLLTYGLLYLLMRKPVRAASRIVLPLFAVLVIAVVFFLDPLWDLLQALHLVGKGS